MRKNIESTCSGEIGCTVHVDFVIPVRLDSVTKGPFSVGCRSAIWSRFSVASNRRREIVGRLIRSARSSYDRASRFILRETIGFLYLENTSNASRNLCFPRLYQNSLFAQFLLASFRWRLLPQSKKEKWRLSRFNHVSKIDLWRSRDCSGEPFIRFITEALKGTET